VLCMFEVASIINVHTLITLYDHKFYKSYRNKFKERSDKNRYFDIEQ